MVYMSHDADYRRSGYEIFLVFLILFQKFFDHIDFYFLLTDTVEFKCNLFCLVKFNLLVHGYHCTLQEKLLYQLCRLYLHRLSQFTNGKLLRDCDRADCLLRFFLFWYRRFYRCGLLSSVLLLGTSILVLLQSLELLALFHTVAVSALRSFSALFLKRLGLYRSFRNP